MFEKVLVAIDGSEMKDKVLEAAVSVAEGRDTFVTLVNVSQESVPPGLPYIPKDYVEEMLREKEKRSTAVLDEAKEKLLEKGLNAVETVALTGDPAREMLDYAKAHGQNLIVIGSRGLGGMRGVMLGSVSYKVSQLSKCPVLIVH